MVGGNGDSKLSAIADTYEDKLAQALAAEKESLVGEADDAKACRSRNT